MVPTRCLYVKTLALTGMVVVVLLCVITHAFFAHHDATRWSRRARNVERGMQRRDSDEPKTRRSLFLFGLDGNVGKAVTRRALMRTPSISPSNDNVCGNMDRVYGTVRSRSHHEENVTQILFRDTRKVQSRLNLCSHVLLTIPPQANGHDAVLDTFHIPSTVLWVGYVSTSGVYGNHDNDWVYEDSDIRCSHHSKAAAYFKTENRLSSFTNIGRVRIFRCAGLYGPEFSALHTLLRSGMPPPADNGNSSRIHLEDVARAIVSSMIHLDTAAGVEIYNLADELPTPRYRVFQHAAQLLQKHGISFPPNNTTEQEERSGMKAMSDRTQRREKEKKRVFGIKARDELLGRYGGWTYPTYREGLLSIFSQMTI